MTITLYCIIWYCKASLHYPLYIYQTMLSKFFYMRHSDPSIIISPLDQFNIRNLLSLDAPILANLHISLTNIGLYLTISAYIVLTLNLLATNYNKVIANQ